MMPRIKIYGERNTNTRYMSQLVRLNLRAREIGGVSPPSVLKLQDILPGNELVRDIYFYLSYRFNLGWKHSRVKPIEVLRKCCSVDNNWSFVTITKNPYSWLLSLHRNPYHQYYSSKPDFETFLQTPWHCVNRDNADKLLRNPIELWNIKNASYLDLEGAKVLNTTSERILEDPEAIIDSISKRFSIPRLSRHFVNFENSTKDKSKNFRYYRDYYLNERWREQLSGRAIAIINRSLDMKLMETFGYQVLPG